MTKERSKWRRLLVSCAAFLMVISMIGTLSGCGCAARWEDEPVHEDENMVDDSQDDDVDNADDADDAETDEDTTEDETDTDVDESQENDISEDEANWDGTDPGESEGEDVVVQNNKPNTNKWGKYSKDPVKKDKDWR